MMSVDSFQFLTKIVSKLIRTNLSAAGKWVFPMNSKEETTQETVIERKCLNDSGMNRIFGNEWFWLTSILETLLKRRIKC